MIPIIAAIVFLGLLIGSITDFKSREVPDFINYSLITLGFTINIILTLVYSNPSYIINSIAGFVAFLIISLIMFYSGQWGGGDSKMLMGLGALIGLDITFKNIFLLDFFFNILVIGGVYGILWSFYLAIKNRKNFVKDYKKAFKNKYFLLANKISIIIFFVSLLLFYIIQDFFIKFLIIGFSILILLVTNLMIFIKAIEKSSMLKLVMPEQLTEGDWIAKDIKYKGKRITGPKDLGIEKKQINFLKKFYKKKVLIKEGIPFVPSFFIAFILSLVYGNLLFLFL